VSEVSDDSIPVTVQILDKEYRIGCRDGEQEALIASAQLVDRRMREVRQSGRVIGSDRVAVMVALNIAHELLEQRKIQEHSEHAIGQRIRSLQQKIESALQTAPAG
jgi:cell division protein ZapA